MMDFEREVRRRQTPDFYRKMAEAYLQSAVDIEQELDQETFVSYNHDKYLLPRLSTYVWQENCEQHEWSHDGTNYRCVLCAHERSLEPIHLELPQEILTQILSLTGKASSFCTRDLHTKYIYENCLRIIAQMPVTMERQYCEVRPKLVTSTIFFDGEKQKAFKNIAVSYRSSGLTSTGSLSVTSCVKTITKKYTYSRTGIYSLPAFIVSIYARLNKFARNMRINKYKVTLLCREQIRKEFRQQLSTEDPLFTLAYRECSLLSFGVPLSITELMTNKDTITVFEKAFAFDRVKVGDAVAVILNAIDAKDRVEVCYGFILLWFSKKYYDDIACCLREKAELVLWK